MPFHFLKVSPTPSYAPKGAQPEPLQSRGGCGESRGYLCGSYTDHIGEANFAFFLTTFMTPSSLKRERESTSVPWGFARCLWERQSELDRPVEALLFRQSRSLYSLLVHRLWATSDSQLKTTQTKAAHGEETPRSSIIV